MELIPFFAETLKIETGQNEDITIWVESNPLLPEYPSVLLNKTGNVLKDKDKNLYFLIKINKILCLFRVRHLGLINYSRFDVLYIKLQLCNQEFSDFVNLFDYPLHRSGMALSIVGVFLISEDRLDPKELKEMGVAYLCLLSKGEIRRKAYEFVMENK